LKTPLRNKVVKTWVRACEKGGWTSTDQLKSLPFSLLTDTRGIGFIEHTLAVTEGAAGLAKAQENTYHKLPYPIDYDRLYAGGLLHDVGKLMEIEPDGKGGFRKSLSGKYARHPVSGAILAAEQGISEDILNTIVCHAKEGEGRPQVLETIFIHQADFATFNPLSMKDKGLLIQEPEKDS
jgi:putative nucleotidyltransferase with HDIG domain